MIRSPAGGVAKRAHGLDSRGPGGGTLRNPENFDHPMKEKYKILKKNGETRGYGYWFWKPIFLLKILNQLNKGDIVHYVDIGCHIQKKNSRFKDYIEILMKNDTWILPFQYYVDSNFSKDILSSAQFC